MPNWVRNIVSFETDKVIKECVDKDGHFDFNKIIPMPKEFADEKEYEKLSLEEKIIFKKKWGENYGWYEWSKEYWGTKWNANDTQVLNDKEVIFDTAWCTPEPIFRAISEKYKTYVTVSFADEGISENSGKIIFYNGCEMDYEMGDDDFRDKVWGYPAD